MQTYVTLVWHCINPAFGDDWTDEVIYAGPDKGQALAAFRNSEIEGHFRIQVWVDGKFEYEETH